MLFVELHERPSHVRSEQRVVAGEVAYHFAQQVDLGLVLIHFGEHHEQLIADDAVKLLIENGANNTEVSKYLKVSADVVSMIRKSETYEEYQNFMYEYLQKLKNRAIKAKGTETKTDKPEEVIKEIRQTVTIQATHYMEEQLKKTNELLTGISAKLAAIIDDLYGTGGRPNA